MSRSFIACHEFNTALSRRRPPTGALRSLTMTLILSFIVGDQAFLFGDLLISTPDGAPVDLPTVGALNPERVPGPVQWYPATTCQKVAIINDRCAIAWAGSKLLARHLVGSLRELAVRGELTLDGARACFDEAEALAAEQGDQLSLLGLLADEQGGFHRLGRNARQLAIPGLTDPILFAGTGGNHVADVTETGEIVPFFAEILARVMEHLATGTLNPKGVPLFLQEQLSFLEMTSGTTIDHLYGGGFEFAVLQGGRVAKFEDATYLLARCILDSPQCTRPEEVLLEPPFRVSRLWYVGHTLFVLSAETLPVFRNPGLYVYVVPDVAEPAPLMEAAERELRARLLGRRWISSTVVAVFDGEPVASVPNLWFEPSGAHTAVRIALTESEWRVDFHEEWLDAVFPLLETIRAKVHSS